MEGGPALGRAGGLEALLEFEHGGLEVHLVPVEVQTGEELEVGDYVGLFQLVLAVAQQDCDDCRDLEVAGLVDVVLDYFCEFGAWPENGEGSEIVVFDQLLENGLECLNSPFL